VVRDGYAMHATAQARLKSNVAPDLAGSLVTVPPEQLGEFV